MKILASDYDGTLNHNGIDDAKKEAIATWRKAGNIFALISGRGMKDVKRIYDKGNFECDYLLADNGAVILTPDGEIVSDIRCDGSIAYPLISFLIESGCPWGNIDNNNSVRVYSKDCCERKSEDYTLDNFPHIEYFNQISTMLPTFEEAEKVTAGIKEKFSHCLNPLQNGQCIDIVSSDVNKAKGLYILIKLLNASKSDVITVGDNINDKDMIAEFRSYAMENGVDSIKALADCVTPGITELIKKEMKQ